MSYDKKLELWESKGDCFYTFAKAVNFQNLRESMCYTFLQNQVE